MARRIAMISSLTVGGLAVLIKGRRRLDEDLERREVVGAEDDLVPERFKDLSRLVALAFMVRLEGDNLEV